MAVLIEVAGWSGAALLLIAYGLLSAGRLGPTSRSYQLINALGATGLIVNSGWNGALPSVAVNVIWLAIGIRALIARTPAATQSVR
jgi:hypothetical protein